MTTTSANATGRAGRWLPLLIGIVVTASLAAGGYFTRERWLPLLTHSSSGSVEKPAPTEEAGHGHDHGGGEGDAQNEIVLSDQARKNLKLKVGTVELQPYWRTVMVPGEVAEHPGRSERRINATVQGVILKVHVLAGQTVQEGDALFDVQITSELLAASQSNLLKTMQDIEVVEAELKRIIPAVMTGSIPKRNQLEKEYEKRRLESTRETQIQELRVRGLTEQQVQELIETKSLLRWFTIRVPKNLADDEQSPSDVDRPGTEGESAIKQTAAYAEVSDKASITYLVEKLEVFPGKLVQQGDELCDLALHDVLQIRGEAFATESELIHETLSNQWPVTAVFELGQESPMERANLQILYASSVVDSETKSFDFFIPLQNEVIHDSPGPNGRTFRSWRFKPGQKVRLLLNVEKLDERIVLPADAVVSEGPDSYVFRINGKKFERQAVTVEHRDTRTVVLANDGSLFPGDEIATNSAYQLNMAIKKASGSGIDPHAGHNH